MSKKKKRKLKRARQVVVIKLPKSMLREMPSRRSSDPFLGIAVQALVGGALYGTLAYLAANRPRPSIAGFVARHPAATLELAAMKSNEVGADIVARGRAAGRRLRAWLEGKNESDARPPDVRAIE